MLKEVQVNMGAMHQTLTATEKKVEMPDVKDVREEEHAEAGGQGKGAEGDLPTVRL